MPRRDATAIILPHASYSYCGECIGDGFAAAMDRSIDTVVVISPVHREPADEIFLTESAAYRVPSGLVAVDCEAIHELESCSTKFIRNDIPHLEEHAIEVQLPFVLRLFPNAGIVRILLGRGTISNVQVLARGLESVFGERYEKVLFIISSNLCSNVPSEEAKKQIAELLRLIDERNPSEIIARRQSGELNACGAGGIAALLMLNLPAIRVVTGRQQNSSDIAGEHPETGTYYGAVALHPENP